MTLTTSWHRLCTSKSSSAALYLPLSYTQIFSCTVLSAHTELFKGDDDTVRLLGHYHHKKKKRRRLKVSTWKGSTLSIRDTRVAAVTYLYLKGQTINQITNWHRLQT